MSTSGFDGDVARQTRFQYRRLILKRDAGMNIVGSLKSWAKGIKRDVVALWIAARDRRVPWYAKAVAGAVAAYALSPIDLIPDFIPILGYLDDLIVVPLGILLAVRLVPAPLMEEFRDQAASHLGKPKSYWGLAVIACIWVVCAIWLLWLLLWPARGGA